MSGPPPTPTILKIMRGNPGKRRLPNEPQPTIPEKCPEPPPHIVGYAADLWWEVAPGLHVMGLLTRLDVPAFSVFCYSYGQWRTACEVLARMADRDEATHGLLIRTVDGNAKRNPLVKIASDAAEDMLRAANEFGLTPIARARLGAAGYAPSSPPSKFDGLIGNGSVVPIRRGDE
jgi:P27 family predicted phage terminase small subunit